MLRITALELPASWGAPFAALSAVAAELARGPETDLVLLPEASLTGYVSPAGELDLTAFAEPADGPTSRAVADLARRARTHVVAPLVLEEDGLIYNAMIAFGRHGEPLFTYRKQHPWIPETWATAGPSPAPVVPIDGVRVTVAICFDVHFFAEDARAARGLDAAELLLFPSAWVEEEDSRARILAELARRHRVAIANANWGPGVVTVPGQGRSAIYDAGGTVLARTTFVRGAPPHIRRVDATLALP